MSQWVILVPRGAEYQAVLRGLRSRNASKNASESRSESRSENSDLQAIAIPAGLAVSTWLGTPMLTQRLKSQESQGLIQILVMGLCGGLSDRTPVGSVVIYDEPAVAARLGIRSVRGLTIDRVLCLAREKRELADRADVVDMESQPIVTYGQSIGFSVRVIRVVSDDASADLPDLSRVFDAAGNLRPIELAIAFGRQPIAAFRLIRGSLRALQTLEQWVAKLDIDHLAV
jgi:hypothetical protein